METIGFDIDSLMTGPLGSLPIINSYRMKSVNRKTTITNWSCEIINYHWALSEQLVWLVSDSLAVLPEVLLVTSLSLLLPSTATKLFLRGTCSGLLLVSMEVKSEPVLVGPVRLTRGRIAVVKEVEEHLPEANLNRSQDGAFFGCLHKNISAKRFLKRVSFLEWYYWLCPVILFGQTSVIGCDCVRHELTWVLIEKITNLVNSWPF